MNDNKSNILIPFDATELSVKALDKAKEIAVNQNSNIIVLYVIDDTSFYPKEIAKFISNMDDFDKMRHNYEKSIREGAEIMIKKQMDSLVEEGIMAKSIIRVGHPADEILTVSKEENVSMIIIGSSGSLKKRHDRKGIGSVSRWISEVATCPVVLVR
ncbi:universal stress protein [Candidatus Nitrosocosmicus agrestis]|jgi:nucleotide-binding universal stress UspA family protein|uniref:universal stress protein n=1 Tax=Candidatus Nitrosocosmicus agrestis TaxID=2563600 RepID=UPI00122E3859|nr:universal stress protein [Candidatus Nitrosocosmicus sp. SS]KAA2283554.1 universal stress protein [Candidatus Nitrosocosmicus sp. SS]KAF0869635.1 universal stress protein [Candidatus Nitrosocosmicus sp. SS]